MSKTVSLGAIGLALACSPKPAAPQSPDAAADVEAGAPPPSPIEASSPAEPLDCTDLRDAPSDPVPPVEVLPKPIQLPPKRECPTIPPGGRPVTIVLAVTIDCEGSVEDVRVTQGFSESCDELVVEAMTHAQFEPAELDTGGHAAVTIRWEWVFAEPE